MFKNFREEQEKANERKLLEAKIADQYKFANTKNKITHTDFLNLAQKTIAEKFLQENGMKNYVFFGGNDEDSERSILLFHPAKFSKEIVEKNVENILCGIRINLPKDLHYEHRIYLSGIMKLGVKREKIGDILVGENGADIIVLYEIADFLKNNLIQLTRFQKANCDIIAIKDIIKVEKKFEEFSVIVSSMRLDNFVSELVKCSRSKALEWIEQQKVLVNYSLETKFSKKILLGDVITIRGKGKFIIMENKNRTKSQKYVMNIKKFV